MNDKETKKLIGEAGYVTDEQLAEFEKKAIASGSTTKEQIDTFEKAQEIETEKYKQHVFEYQRYTDLAQVVRSLLLAIQKLNATGNKSKIAYWSHAVNSWVTQAWKVLNNKELFNPPLTRQLVDDLHSNIENLRRLKPTDIKDVGLLVDDLQYRLSAMYGSLVTLDGIKQYAIERRHSDMVEYITNRIKLLEERQLNPTGLDTTESLNNDAAVIIELRGLIYHENKSKTNA